MTSDTLYLSLSFANMQIFIPRMTGVVSPWTGQDQNTWLAHLATMQDDRKFIVSISHAVTKNSDLWPAPGSPSRWSCGAAHQGWDPATVLQGRFCCHHLAFPYTKFLKAPQALRWTSVIRWSSKSWAGCPLVSLSGEAKEEEGFTT